MHTLWRQGATKDLLVGYTTDREFTYTTCCANVTLPRRFYLVVEIIPYRALRISVRFDNAIDGADSHALGGIVMALAFDTGGLIDHIEDAVAFADGFSRAFRYARATGDAIFSNFHCHSRYSFKSLLPRI